jgi:hypothetical protein
MWGLKGVFNRAGKRFLSIEIEHCFSGHFVDVHYSPFGHAAYIVEWLLPRVKRTSRLHSEASAYDPFRTLKPAGPRFVLAQCEPRHADFHLAGLNPNLIFFYGLATGSTHAPAPSDRILRRVDLRNVSRARRASADDAPYEGHCAGKDDAGREGVEDARVRKADGATKD